MWLYSQETYILFLPEIIHSVPATLLHTTSSSVPVAKAWNSQLVIIPQHWLKYLESSTKYRRPKSKETQITILYFHTISFNWELTWTTLGAHEFTVCFSGGRVAQSLVFCVVFCGPLLFYLSFWSIRHYRVCPSTIYVFSCIVFSNFFFLQISIYIWFGCFLCLKRSNMVVQLTWSKYWGRLWSHWPL